MISCCLWVCDDQYVKFSLNLIKYSMHTNLMNFKPSTVLCRLLNVNQTMHLLFCFSMGYLKFAKLKKITITRRHVRDQCSIYPLYSHSVFNTFIYMWFVFCFKQCIQNWNFNLIFQRLFKPTICFLYIWLSRDY